MKRFLLSLTAICAAVSLNAQITYDVETTLISPASGSSTSAPGVVTVDFSFTNNGPDALPMNDTIFMGYWIDNDLFSLTHGAGEVTGIILPADIPSGASITATQLGGPIDIDLTGKPAGTSVCIAFFGTGTEVLTGPDTEELDNSNNEDCFTLGTASVNENEISALVYPNPASDVLNIELNEVATNVTIVSLDGKVVVSETVNSNNVSVDVANLVPGTYVYAVETANGSVRNTFVKK